jgi:DNA-binding transcriptional LysR family regulator
MMNIPTDLLRTLVAVVDLRSFTKAAQSFGVTQPAVSAQIKRLQFLLGFELLDKSAPGVSLTPRGQEVVSGARRMLAINDQILNMTSGTPTMQALRINIPGDSIGARIPAILADFRKRWPSVRFNVNGGSYDQAVRGLEKGELDLAVALSKSEPTIEARHRWIDPAVWVRSNATQLDPHAPVPLVQFGEDCACAMAAVQTLERIGREYEFAFLSRSMVSLEAAVTAGIGVLVLPRSRVGQTGLTIWEDAPLPELPQIYCGVFVREGNTWEPLEKLADEIAAVLRPKLEVTEGGAAPVHAARMSEAG